MNSAVREHLRANLEARLAAHAFPPPTSGYLDGPYLIDLVWPQVGVAVMLAWPGRVANNDLVIAGWGLLYFEGSEVFTRETLETIGKAIGHEPPPSEVAQPTYTEPILGGGFIPGSR